MELKFPDRRILHPAPPLLIVPYGIEIEQQNQFIMKLRLLIVPYGIEMIKALSWKRIVGLLIVPYGIEM